MALARAGTLALAAAMRRQSVTVSATVLLALSVPGAGSGMQAWVGHMDCAPGART